MNVRENATNLFAIGVYYWLTGDERQANEYWQLANKTWSWHNFRASLIYIQSKPN